MHLFDPKESDWEFYYAKTHWVLANNGTIVARWKPTPRVDPSADAKAANYIEIETWDTEASEFEQALKLSINDARELYEECINHGYYHDQGYIEFWIFERMGKLLKETQHVQP